MFTNIELRHREIDDLLTDERNSALERLDDLSRTLFFMTAGVTTVFVITILAMVAMLVGDPEAPINVWFNDHGAIVMTVEVVAIGVLGMGAMIADRQETLQEQRLQQKNPHARSNSISTKRSEDENPASR